MGKQDGSKGEPPGVHGRCHAHRQHTSVSLYHTTHQTQMSPARRGQEGRGGRQARVTATQEARSRSHRSHLSYLALAGQRAAPPLQRVVLQRQGARLDRRVLHHHAEHFCQQREQNKRSACMTRGDRFEAACVHLKRRKMQREDSNTRQTDETSGSHKTSSVQARTISSYIWRKRCHSCRPCILNARSCIASQQPTVSIKLRSVIKHQAPTTNPAWNLAWVDDNQVLSMIEITFLAMTSCNSWRRRRLKVAYAATRKRAQSSMTENAARDSRVSSAEWPTVQQQQPGSGSKHTARKRMHTQRQAM